MEGAMKQYFKSYLSEKEQDIMTVLWGVASPLSVSEICDNAENMGVDLNQSTVQMTVNKLQKKGLIRVGEIIQNHKSLARAFEPAISYDDFVVLQLQQILGGASKDKRASYISALIDEPDPSGA
jgi:predicted transcriptional regulator